MSAHDAIAGALAALQAERSELDQAIANLEVIIARRARSEPPTKTAPPPKAPAPPARKLPGAVRPREKQAPGKKRPGKLAGREAEIRGLFESGTPMRAIAKKMDCTPWAISLMAKREGWKAAKPAPPTAAVPIRRIPRGVSGRTEE